MSFKLKENRGVISEPISFRDTTGLNAEYIASEMKAMAVSQGVPVLITVDVMREGGLFGSEYPCVVIEHPNPPQRYFTDVYVINGNTVNFFYFGESKANTSVNKAEYRKSTLMGSLVNSVIGSSEMALQQEMSWHRQVYELFESMIN